MATINGSTNSNLWTFKLEAYEISYSVANNTSVVRVDVYIGRTSTRSYCGGSFNGNVIVDGQVQNFSGTISYPTYIDGGAWLYVGVTKDFTVGHNNDGTKTASVSASWGADFTPSSANASGAVTLTNIPRQAKITNTPTSLTDESTFYFSFSNPANAQMSCWLEINPNSEHLAQRTLTGSSGTYTWELTTEEINQIQIALANASKGVGICRIGLYSYIGQSTFADFKDIQISIINANPIFTNYEIYDANPTTVALTGNSDVMVKGHSTVRSRFYPRFSSPQKNATLVKYVAGNKTAPYDSENIVSIDNENYSLNNITLYVFDSRDFATSQVSEFSVHGYIEYFDIIKNNISVERSNSGVGTQVTLSFGGSWWNGNFGSVINNLTCSYKFKKTTDTNWNTGETVITPIIDQNNFSFEGLIKGDSSDNGFEVNNAYDIVVTVTDELSTAEFKTLINSGAPAIAVYRNKASLGDKYNTSLGGTQLWGDVFLNGESIRGSYSTNEIDTGKTWINNEKIYEKAFYFTQWGGLGYDTGITNIDNIIDSSVSLKNTETSQWRKLAYDTNGIDGYYIKKTGDTYKIVIQNNGVYTADSVCAYIDYTKTSN